MRLLTTSELRLLWAEQKRNGEAVRMMTDDGVTPEVGHFYTVSKCFTRADGSWTGDFWEVLAINGPKAYVRIHERNGGTINRFWEINDRAWYLADDAWAIAQSTPDTKEG